MLANTLFSTCNDLFGAFGVDETFFLKGAKGTGRNVHTNFFAVDD